MCQVRSKMERRFFPRREVSSLLRPEGIWAGWRKRKCLKAEIRKLEGAYCSRCFWGRRKHNSLARVG